MSEKSYDEAFLFKLMTIVSELSEEGMPEDAHCFKDNELADEPSVAAQSERDEFAALQPQLAVAFADVAQFISDKLGAGTITSLDDERLRGIARDALEAVEDWDDGEVAGTNPIRPTPAFQKLLAAHQAVCDTVGAIQFARIARRMARGR